MSSGGVSAPLPALKTARLPLVVCATTRGYREMVRREVSAGDVVLEVGSAAGVTTSMLAGLVADGCCVGIDNNPKEVRAARARFPDLDLRVVDATDEAALRALAREKRVTKIFVDVAGTADVDFLVPILRLLERVFGACACLVVKSLKLARFAQLLRNGDARAGRGGGGGGGGGTGAGSTGADGGGGGDGHGGRTTAGEAKLRLVQHAVEAFLAREGVACAVLRCARGGAGAGVGAGVGAGGDGVTTKRAAKAARTAVHRDARERARRCGIDPARLLKCVVFSVAPRSNGDAYADAELAMVVAPPGGGRPVDTRRVARALGVTRECVRVASGKEAAAAAAGKAMGKAVRHALCGYGICPPFGPLAVARTLVAAELGDDLLFEAGPGVYVRVDSAAELVRATGGELLPPAAPAEGHHRPSERTPWVVELLLVAVVAGAVAGTLIARHRGRRCNWLSHLLHN